ncbi:hypothetical protein STSP2_01583 [Anaerohalosphaera lusitana]|uniref:Uncharacterized protein n=1 Tax=Anaerohalosphaera lusitana TaxID=1936003 RepID=A0A1U9NKF8_9BACT|nr:hypothetical protein [Anaerohalosphaera lusitana]AQT68423.1 hypothetical protein STSP2_01583 [Anaerohalosphaera lusitana]
MIRIFLFLILGTCASALAAGTLCDGGDIRRARETAHETYGQFLSETLTQRMGWFCQGDNLQSDPKSKLAATASDTVSKLHTVLQKQQTYRDQIENYDGEDWDRRFGSNGLWRRLVADIASTRLLIARCNFWQAVNAQGENRRQLIESITQKCAPLRDVFTGGEAQVMSLRAQSLNENNRRTIEAAQSMLRDERLPAPVRIDAAALLNRCTEPPNPQTIEKLADKLQQGPSRDNYEPWLKLALVGLKVGSDSIISNVLERWPALRTHAGMVLLDAAPNRKIDKMTTLEAKLIATETLRRDPADYTALLKKIRNTDHLASAPVCYASAKSLAETNAFKAIELYMRAADKQRDEQDKMLTLSGAEIAAEGARCAYGLYYQDSHYLRIARDTMAYYFTLAGDTYDEQLRYLYALLLKENGRTDHAKTIFSELTDQAETYAPHAQFENLLIKYDTAANPDKKRNIRKQLQNLLDQLNPNTQPQRDLRLRALATYGNWLLETDNEDAPTRILNLIDPESAARTEHLCTTRTRALLRADKHTHAVTTLLQFDKPDSDWAATGIHVLTEILNGGENVHASGAYTLTPPPAKYLSLADKCLRILPTPTAKLTWAELTILSQTTDTPNRTDLNEIREILEELTQTEYSESVPYLRCRARFFTLQNKFTQARRLWTTIAAHRKSAQNSNTPSWQWWRAKYHELQNWSQTPKTNPADLNHAVDVLLNSFSEIPEPWPEKFVSLKETGK